MKKKSAGAALSACLTKAALAAPTAPFLVGLWECTTESGDAPFLYRASDDHLPGGWLYGEAFRDGRRLAFEAWSFDADGQLHERRQFTPSGAFAALRVTERSSDGLASRVSCGRSPMTSPRRRYRRSRR